MPVVADAYENRVMLNGAEGLEQSPAPTIVAVGNGAGSYAPYATPVDILSTMSAEEVAQAIKASLDAVFAGGKPSFKVDGSVVRMIGHQVWDSGPLPYAYQLPGDLPIPVPKDYVDPFNNDIVALKRF